MMDRDAKPRAPRGRVVIGGDLDRRRAEALCLEIRTLARQYGVDVAELRVVCGSGQIEEVDNREPGA
jgi:nucleotide-binding universal stress UspA family protein